MKLPATWLSWLEDTVNGVIALDPEFPPRLDALRDRTLRLEIAGMNLEVYIGVMQRRLTLRQSHSGEPDVIVRGAPLGLLNLLRTEDPMALVQEGLIELRGDAQLAREFKKIFGSLDIDWEEKISRVIGDWPAHQMGILAGRFRRWRRRSDESVHRTFGEFLQEESRLLPARIEIENFVADVDALREALDRLEARLNNMQAAGRGR
jgi:ubiquinone biosynthesis protein UbiJ